MPERIAPQEFRDSPEDGDRARAWAGREENGEQVDSVAVSETDQAAAECQLDPGRLRKHPGLESAYEIIPHCPLGLASLGWAGVHELQVDTEPLSGSIVLC